MMYKCMIRYTLTIKFVSTDEQSRRYFPSSRRTYTRKAVLLPAIKRMTKVIVQASYTRKHYLQKYIFPLSAHVSIYL
jgi:hypothetical protein